MRNRGSKFLFINIENFLFIDIEEVVTQSFQKGEENFYITDDCSTTTLPSPFIMEMSNSRQQQPTNFSNITIQKVNK
ncbi:hypothetical protein LguiB_001341 [Lonicera macranthoides]